jgi:hypothetical protein
MDLGDDRHRGAGLSRCQSRPLTGKSGANDHYVVRGHEQQV